MGEGIGFIFFGLIVWVVLSVISGLIGSFFGSKVEKTASGFWLGFFLSAVGWIIVLLLPREQESKEVTTTQKIEQGKRPDRRERNLESDVYKIWLGKTYKIQKNELFEKYEINGSLFDTLDEALADADQKEREKEEKFEPVERDRQERQEKKEREKIEIDYEKVERRRIEKEKQKSADKVVMLVGIAGVFLLALFYFWSI